MTGRIVNYDKAGANPYSAVATNSLLKELVDDKQYEVVNLSEAPNALDDLHSNPVKLFVVSGGSAKDMSLEFLDLSHKIHDLVKVYGGGYWGNGAGAVIACNEMLYFQEAESKPMSQPVQYMTQYPPLRGRPIKLYSSNCCLFQAPGYELPGTQLVRKVAFGAQPLHHLYSHMGIFFPDARSQPNTEVILESAFHRFSSDEVPVVALKQKVGSGSALLCGAQPEMGQEIVRQMTFDSDEETEAQNSAIGKLNGSKGEHKNTMRSFLNALSIVTKKV